MNCWFKVARPAVECTSTSDTLFSMGVNTLNIDGTTQKDASGAPIPNYTADDVHNAARALTGWTYARLALRRSRTTSTSTTVSSIRTLETSHPPSYYIPPDALAPGVLRRAAGSSFCEWKGAAVYWDVVIGDVVLPRVGWSYPNPSYAFESLRDHIAFYAAPFDRCSVDGETVTPQPGEFYGGWITSLLAGPFKGVPGSRGW